MGCSLARKETMPSPFSGMDPYLEGSLWMTVHTQLSAEIARQLAPKLRPKYLALTTERFVYEEAESVAIATSSLYPDVGATPSLRIATIVPASVPHVTVE